MRPQSLQTVKIKDLISIVYKPHGIISAILVCFQASICAFFMTAALGNQCCPVLQELSCNWITTGWIPITATGSLHGENWLRPLTLISDLPWSCVWCSRLASNTFLSIAAGFSCWSSAVVTSVLPAVNEYLTFSMVMFHVKLSTALCSFRPFSPSFTAKSWRFSWNSIAGRKRQMRTSEESVFKGLNPWRFVRQKSSCEVLSLLSLWGNTLVQRHWHVLSTFNSLLLQQKGWVCGSTEILWLWRRIPLSLLYVCSVIMTSTGR